MKIRFAKNLDMIDGGMEIESCEFGGKMGLERVRQLSQDGIIIATDIFKKYPEIKQIILDTTTDEERDMISQALSESGGKA